MANGEGCYSVSNNILKFTTDLASFLRANFLKSKRGLTSLLVEYQVIHGANSAFLTVFFKQRLHVWERIKVELGPFHRHLFENHIVLS